ncbi:hypothetical protein J2Y38_000583 [Flavobacterium sp. 2755]|uniref:hypothetical protein n=1 Tax=Flavobacterium sp. 2755 TaxID=2817765 RepID=UPI0028651013|nr:hypothetical protein [Flavobacterium sp. 2755]MDR6760404.1 hypothetical protein [Flavobacterium sp. 2755]
MIKNIDKIQNLLPLGYLFLILLGITKDSIFYYLLGINIIRYSSIMDILISPLAATMSHPVFFVTVLALFIFYYNVPKLLLNKKGKNWLPKITGVKTGPEFEKLPENEKLEYYNIIAIQSLSTFLISVFLGYGLADGISISNKIKNNTLNYNYTLNYSDEKSENIYIIGSNTAYYFYTTQGNPTIKIAPISSIKNLEFTKNKMLDK